MNKIYEILLLLYDRDYINNYVKLLKSCKEGVITRHKEILNTVACRLWQLQYCIFYYIYNRDKELLQNPDFMLILCAVYNKILTEPKTGLGSFILLNTLNESTQYISFMNNDKDSTHNNNFINYINNNINTYCCIYGINKKTGVIQENGVVHYFTLINDKMGNYYITSSYGSDKVCVPYQTEKLESLDEFIIFCRCLYLAPLSNNEFELNEYNKCIIIFMNKYFLKGGIKKRWSEDWVDEYPNLRHKWIEPLEGIIKEAKYITQNTIMNFDIAIISNYQTLIEKELSTDVETDKYISDKLINEINEITKRFKNINTNKKILLSPIRKHKKLNKKTK